MAVDDGRSISPGIRSDERRLGGKGKLEGAAAAAASSVTYAPRHTHAHTHKHEGLRCVTEQQPLLAAGNGAYGPNARTTDGAARALHLVLCCRYADRSIKCCFTHFKPLFGK